MSCKSIGFTATLPTPELGDSVPFFTPNRKTSHNVLDLVETTGKFPLYISTIIRLVDLVLTQILLNTGTYLIIARNIVFPRLTFLSFIPEFISRLPSITTLAPLTVADLRRILTEVKGSLMSQYQSLFGYSGVEIRFTNSAIDEICHKASERGGGARGLRGIMVCFSYPFTD